MLAQLLESARASPHDDAPLLVIADQLLARGNTHGEFIHLQCKRARLPPEHPERPSLEAREKALLAADGAKWLGPAWHPLIEFEFVRGVPTGRFGHAGAFLSAPAPPMKALRFYAWGWAFSLGFAGDVRRMKDLDSWVSDKSRICDGGAVTPQWRDDGLALRFEQTGSSGTVRYDGLLRDGRFECATHSLINGHRGQHVFMLAEVRDCETRPSFVKPDESTWDGQHDGHS